MTWSDFSVSWYSPFQWPLPSHLHLSHPLAVSWNRVSFPITQLGNVKADILSLTASLSPPTCLLSCSPWIYIWLQQDHYPRISCLHFPCGSWLLRKAPWRNHSLTALLHSCALCSLHTIWKISPWINTICELSCWEVSGENQAAFWIFIVINLNNLPATVGNLPAFL